MEVVRKRMNHVGGKKRTAVLVGEADTPGHSPSRLWGQRASRLMNQGFVKGQSATIPLNSLLKNLGYGWDE